MKMKLQRRTKIALIGIVLLSLFASSFCANARTQITSITFSETAEIGKIFEINVAFSYQYSGDCLYGDYITLYYDVGTDPVLDYTQKIIVAVDELDDAPRPAGVLIEVDLSTITCAVNDTFLFRIKHTMGVIGEGLTYPIGTTNSEMYELTIVKAKRVSIPIAGIIIPLLVLSTFVLIVKKKRIKKVK